MDLETGLVRAFVAAHPAQVARMLESMSADDAAAVLASLSVDALADLLPRLDAVSAASSLELVTTEETAEALSLLRRDAAASILRAMPPEHRSKVVQTLKPETRNSLESVLRYAEGTAGALMDPAVLTVAESVTVGDALDRLRMSPQHVLYYVYVVAEGDQRLVGVVNIRQLMEARADQIVGLIAVHRVESLPAGASSETIIAHPAWKRFHALPVVATNGRFLGAVRYKSLRQLEGRFVEAGGSDAGTRTAAALGELYSLGFRGLFELAASTLLPTGGPERGGR